MKMNTTWHYGGIAGSYPPFIDPDSRRLRDNLFAWAFTSAILTGIAGCVSAKIKNLPNSFAFIFFYIAVFITMHYAYLNH